MKEIDSFVIRLAKSLYFLGKNIDHNHCNIQMALKDEIHRIVLIQTFRKTIL